MNEVAFLTTVFPMNLTYLKEMLDSLVKQSVKDFDLIVVNDGLEEFSNLVSCYSDILNILEISGGSCPAKNRQEGINYCIRQGYKFIVFGDSDDTFSSNRIKLSIELLKTFDVVVNDLTLFSTDAILAENYISNRLKNYDQIEFDFIKNKNLFGLSNTAIRLDRLAPVDLPNELIAVDWYLFSILLLQGKKAVFTNNTVTFYRQYEGNLVGLKQLDSKSFSHGLKVKQLHYTALKAITDRVDVEFQNYCQRDALLKAKNAIEQPLWWELI